MHGKLVYEYRVDAQGWGCEGLWRGDELLMGMGPGWGRDAELPSKEDGNRLALCWNLHDEMLDLLGQAMCFVEDAEEDSCLKPGVAKIIDTVDTK